jgi:hypothetical protein
MIRVLFLLHCNYYAMILAVKYTIFWAEDGYPEESYLLLYNFAQFVDLLAIYFMLVFCSSHYSTLKKKETCFSETSADFQGTTARCRLDD